MNRFGRAGLCAAILCAAASAVAAQTTGFAGLEFATAVREGKADEALALLNSTPTVINARDGKGETALYIAVAARNSTWTGFLLQRGADPDLAARSGETPLIAAARLGYFEGLAMLLSQGAKVDATNRMGETALIVAVHNRKPQIVRALLESGADPDRTDNAAGLAARDYAKRDPRSRDILRMIETRKPAAAN